ncbi:MAG: ABC transporter permease [Ezakiella sp.]|nr:ABC transporter permease [Ezakiella sp.]MDD7472025.1 ABC transporter permease [Bacillota bacterium]MDY3923989.1 ABC transporter permease [Ezakiella sp.]
MEKQSFVKRVGLPRIIIFVFIVALFIIGGFIGVDLKRSLVDVITRFGMNAILVLSMIPMIQAGCGLNFGLPVGLIGGMLGAVLSLEFELKGFSGFVVALAIGMIFGAIFGWLYGLILNKVKGDEMIIATYVGFSFVALMNIFWVILPFKNPESVMGFNGEGLRTTISLGKYWDKAVSKIFGITLSTNSEIGDKLLIPTGMFIVFAVFAYIVYLFFKSKKGTTLTAVGSNENYARAAGVNVDRSRLLAVILSCSIGAAGMVMYQQSYGFVQMYNAPLAFAFPSVAAILLGGASINKANIKNVLIGAFLFQGILTMTPTVINTAIKVDISEVLRLIISNGLIVFALTRKEGGNN